MKAGTRHAGWFMAGATAAALGLLSPVAWAQPKPPQEVYTCIDKTGRRITADRPIADCVDREQRILDHTGAERRRIGPTLTEHERAALEVQRRKEAQERARIAEERRRERVLMARYPDEAAHQVEREAALVQVDEVMAVARKRIQELQVERKRIDGEMEFYRRDPLKAPMKLQRQIAENDEAVAEQQRFLTAQDQEKRRIHQRFDAELAQLRQLWAAQRAAASQLVPPQSTLVSPGASR
ncbi:MAG: DUF4124 domain-containing protein [Acidovorax sp.]|uniref:DUF4124 domain-containing protein n=2 Tax=Diaphorobacter TaxID=238749 RepID=A0A9J9QB12_ACIET|nr:conserved hypothetical protein [Acidovorax sp. JS42]ACM31713.1 conserved hypothetical protein [[Acidovorax] ebreus TPSY]POR12691.1 DUF4124 domain-containing protein [Diaphorobacter sp. LR2014-1]PZU40707.1 MAG: DUF4124 domain-containing protein [Acidovorax sp.]TFI42948.1 DUF4124 domain-containing protein [Diaphorobacter sp. DS2]